MRKLVSLGLCLLLLCCALRPVRVFAVVPLEPERDCSLTLQYSKDDIAFSDVPVRIYRVAEAFEDSTFQLVEPFSEYPVNIHGITSQQEWSDVAATLSAYIVAHQVVPAHTQATDEQGLAVFSGLQTGLYLVCSAVAEHNSGQYYFSEFMVYLPTPQEGEGFEYDVQANPKCSQFEPGDHYSVVKLWRDAGNEEKRPDEVAVDIYKDGELQNTVTLSSENNWSYSWDVPDRQGIWTVVERDVPEPYQVSITARETAFVITNTYDSPNPPPQTGDLFPIWPLMFVLCFAGCALLLLGTRYERKRT